MTRFRAGGRDLTDVTSRAAVLDYTGGCEYGRDGVTVNLNLVLGPSAVPGPGIPRGPTATSSRSPTRAGGSSRSASSTPRSISRPTWAEAAPSRSYSSRSPARRRQRRKLRRGGGLPARPGRAGVQSEPATELLTKGLLTKRFPGCVRWSRGSRRPGFRRGGKAAACYKSRHRFLTTRACPETAAARSGNRPVSAGR